MSLTANRLQKDAIICLLLIAFVCPPTWGHVESQEVFAPIPESLRGRLVERMRLLVKYQRAQQWEKQYDLLSELYTQGKSKEAFTKELRRFYAQGLGNKLLDFTPTSVVVRNESVDHGEWTIYGCAKLREKKRIVRLYASVDAHREKGDWFFSEVGIITPIDGNAKPCPH